MIDKNCTRQILGSLLKQPDLLSQVDKYNLTTNDFSSRFEQIIFSAIFNLYHSGAPRVSIVDIENYLNNNLTSKSIFEQQKGIEQLLDMEELSNPDNFPYYYKKLKKINLIKDLKKNGFKTDGFYSENVLDPDAIEINARFEELDISDIINSVKGTVAKIESNYAETAEVQTVLVSDVIDDFIDNIGEVTDIGTPIQGKCFNEIIHGAVPGTLTVRSAGSGVGKTRNATADACYLAFPMRYEWEKGEWVVTGSCEKILYIITEQSVEEILKMVAAYLTGINEEKFRFGNFNKQEQVVISQAKEVIKAFKENLIIVKMPNPTIELVKTTVRNQCILHSVSTVFYDYIFIGPALLNEFKGFTLRNDEVLLMFSTALKDLAQELNVAVFTSTQVNANSDQSRDIRNESSLAGSRSIINKADNGCIMARPSREELELIEPITRKFGIPNLVTDIFKVRSGRWTQVRVWSAMDLGVMRKRDLFVTDSALNLISDFEIISDGIVDWTEEYSVLINRIINKLNGAK